MSETMTAEPVTTRSIEEINAEIAREKAEFARLMAENDAYNEQRKIKVARREKFEGAWKAQNPGTPFDPESYHPPAYVPDANSPVQGEFHAKHYTLARLDAELMAAKKHATGLL